MANTATMIRYTGTEPYNEKLTIGDEDHAIYMSSGPCEFACVSDEKAAALLALDCFEEVGEIAPDPKAEDEDDEEGE